MPNYEVSEPIQNSAFEEPARHGYVREGEEAELREGGGSRNWDSTAAPTGRSF